MLIIKDKGPNTLALSSLPELKASAIQGHTVCNAAQEWGRDGMLWDLHAAHTILLTSFLHLIRAPKDGWKLFLKNETTSKLRQSLFVPSEQSKQIPRTLKLQLSRDPASVLLDTRLSVHQQMSR